MAVTRDFSAAECVETSGFWALLENAKTRFANYRMYRKTVKELSGLSTRELDDLGLNRAMLQSVAYQAAYENAPR